MLFITRCGCGRACAARGIFFCCLAVIAPGFSLGAEERGKDLRLVPFPKEVRLGQAEMRLTDPMRIRVDDGVMARQAAADLAAELGRFAGVKSRLHAVSSARRNRPWRLTLASPNTGRVNITSPAKTAGYLLVVGKDFAVVDSRDEVGLVWGVQTLRQLVRANLRDGAIPCVSINDWPSLRYRGFQDDLTRGPSSKLKLLERQVRLGSFLKQNFFTYYMEHQFAHKKHPFIGPKDGSFQPAELKALVVYAKRYGLEIVGNQQSFAHFYHILKHDQFKALRETMDVLNPTVEGTYELLDDMYADQIPLLESKFFNVCCDETANLGKGPAKALVDKIGVGAVYVRHIRRVHELIAKKYGKRMMMWGDIILKHPKQLAEIPRDVVMLSWGYSAQPSFEAAIIPFAKSGHEFFVCPGVSCWSRILPDFGVAVTNIHNYVRDGAKYGALGMLNTVWDDDGENFFAPNVHGIAWGAECSWNGSTTRIEDFNRRIGGVLFGTPSDHFGQAIALLGRAHRLPGYEGMRDRRFWQEDTAFPASEKTAREQAGALLAITRPALEHLRAAQKQAKVNGDLLDYFIFGAERMQLMATRMVDYLAAARAYQKAILLTAEPAKAVTLIHQAETTLEKTRDEHARLKARYIELWNRENKPHALDRVTARFDRLIGQYDQRITKLCAARKALGHSSPGRSSLPPL